MGKYPGLSELIKEFQNVECPVCGERRWRHFGELGNLFAAIPTMNARKEIVSGGGASAVLGALSLTCEGCGLVRLHELQTLGQARAEPIERRRELKRLYARRDQVELSLLANALAELVTLVGKLNALVGTEETIAEHLQIKEELFEVFATVRRLESHFAPPPETENPE